MKPNTSIKKVFVGLSGGVDSSVSAALLQRAGYEVTGVFMKVWSPNWLPCTWKEERRDAMRVAAHLGIPFLTFDFEKEYKQAVVDYLIAEYKVGRTPNPDILCNKEIKFGVFLREAMARGADFIATGHYAQNKAHELYAGTDTNKDQSYFLWTLTQAQLQKIFFPVGHLEKGRVRKLAKKFGLPTAEKKDSQGICFLGPIDMKEFLAHYITTKPGNILDENGHCIGTHDGALLYTLGERHGFTITEAHQRSLPYYIIAKDVVKNTISVSHNYNQRSLAQTTTLQLTAIHWISEQPQPKKNYGARFRYRQPLVACSVENSSVHFVEPQAAVTPGQSLVLYDGQKCLGGGIIDLL